MKILLTGATGFIGGHISRGLQQAGHEVLPVSRQHGYDFKRMSTEADWLPLLQGVDAVINSVGIIVETRGQRFEDLHYRAPAALFRACEQAGVRRVIQISALGVDDQAFTAYQLSKKAADDELRGLDLDWFVLRPSLVYGEGGSSMAMFRRMAALPVIPLVGNGQQQIQPVHVDDVVATVISCLTANPAQRTLDVVGAQALSFVDWLQLIRTSSGKKRAPVLAAPVGLVMASAQLMRFVVPILHPDNLRMLQNGNTSNVAPLSELLGRSPLSPAQGLERDA